MFPVGGKRRSGPRSPANVMWGDLESRESLLNQYICVRARLKIRTVASLARALARARAARATGLCRLNKSDPILKIRKEQLLIFPLACDLVLAGSREVDGRCGGMRVSNFFEIQTAPEMREHLKCVSIERADQ